MKLTAIKRISRVIIGLTMFTSCVHEFPKLPEATNFTLHLDFDTDLPLHKEMVHSKSRGSNNVADYDVRHIVSVHRMFTDGGYDRTADTTIVFTCSDAENLNCSRELTLGEGDYKFFVWTDYVNFGSRADKYYKADNFTEIILKDRSHHIGSCDYRDAFRGEEQVAVKIKKNEMMNVSNEATVTMKRPLAKFKFISTDYEQFLENALRAEAKKKGKSITVVEGGGDEESRTIDLSDFIVTFRYTGFMPCSYNMFTDKPADSWTGVSFSGSVNPIGNNNVELGYDYVFVNGTESGVSVMLEVYHKDGELVASSPSIDVPLKRSRLTVVKGSFLTSIAMGGVGIVPDFEGEYNIEFK